MNTTFLVGGMGQIGTVLKDYLIKQNEYVIITSRYKNKKIKTKNAKIISLNINDKIDIKKKIELYNPDKIFYLAGQSSPRESIKKKKITFKSNFNGCKNFLEIIHQLNNNIKFINACSSEIFDKSKNKLRVTSNKKPSSPYGLAKLKSFNLTKYYRLKKNLKCYNAILFNTESVHRKDIFLLPKICKAAINASKYKMKTTFGNIEIVREWNWADDQCDLLVKFAKKKPQDFILSNGKPYSVRKMISYAFQYLKLDYKKYIKVSKKYYKKGEAIKKKSDYSYYLKKNNIKKKNFIHGKKLVHLMIRFYLNKQNSKILKSNI